MVRCGFRSINDDFDCKIMVNWVDDIVKNVLNHARSSHISFNEVRIPIPKWSSETYQVFQTMHDDGIDLYVRVNPFITPLVYETWKLDSIFIKIDGVKCDDSISYTYSGEYKVYIHSEYSNEYKAYTYGIFKNVEDKVDHQESSHKKHKKKRNVRHPRYFDHLSVQKIFKSKNYDTEHIAIKNIFKECARHYYQDPEFYLDFTSIKKILKNVDGDFYYNTYILKVNHKRGAKYFVISVKSSSMLYNYDIFKWESTYGVHKTLESALNSKKNDKTDRLPTRYKFSS